MKIKVIYGIKQFNKIVLIIKHMYLKTFHLDQ